MGLPMIKLIRIRRENEEKGQALAEFALLIPIFLILLFAIVDFGMGFHSWITVTNSAREGARLGAVSATMEKIEERVRLTANLPKQDINMTVTVTNSVDTGGQPGESVVVQVDYDYDLITPLAGLVGNIFGPTLTFSSTAEMRLE
jgi:Flp pilus assembly protein TadG